MNKEKQKKDLNITGTDTKVAINDEINSSLKDNDSITQYRGKYKSCTIKYGERFKAFRLIKGMSQKKVADAMGINSLNISNYELNKSRPSLESIIKMADVFNISIDKLLGHEVNYSKTNKDEEMEILELLESLQDNSLVVQVHRNDK